jgi:hypothetical protein
MLNFLFWNINRNPVTSLIAGLAHEHEVDVLVLAECEIPSLVLLQGLNENRADFHYAPSRVPTAIEVFTRFSPEFLVPTFESGRISIRRMVLPARPELLIAMVHLPSKSYWSAESQTFECGELARTVREEEGKAGHCRTLLMGDFNVDPFEPGMVSAAGLHGLMTRQLASRRVRTVQGREYPMFYNPMWGHFGDRAPGPAGSYYYERAEHVVHYWHLFDQVLIRPDVLDFCPSDPVTIITRLEETSLVLESGRPDDSVASDHLPVLFRLSV